MVSDKLATLFPKLRYNPNKRRKCTPSKKTKEEFILGAVRWHKSLRWSNK